MRDMRDVNTSHILGLCGALGRQPGCEPKFVEACLVSVEIVPHDWQERSEDGGYSDKEKDHAFYRFTLHPHD
jgi:hypothetical protein